MIGANRRAGTRPGRRSYQDGGRARCSKIVCTVNDFFVVRRDPRSLVMSSQPQRVLPQRQTAPLVPLPGREEAARLPAPLTTLVGREREIAAFGALLRDPAVRL